MGEARGDLDQKRLRWLTAVLGLSVALPLFIIWIFVIFFETGLSHERAKSENATTARGVSRLVDKSFSDALYHLQGHNHEFVEAFHEDDQEQLRHTIEEVLLSSPSISSIALSTKDGRGLAHVLLPGDQGHDSVDCPEATAVDWSNEAWFGDYLAAGRSTVLSNTYLPACAPATPNTAVVVPLRERGEVLGIVRASFDGQGVGQWCDALQLSDGAQLTLIDGHGMVLYDSKLTNSLSVGVATRAQKDLRVQPYFRKISKDRHFVDIFENPITKQSEIVAYEPVKDASWGVIVRQPLGIVDAPIKLQMFKFSGAMAAVLALGLTLVNSVRSSYKRESSLAHKLRDSVHDLSVISDISLEISRGLEVEALLKLVSESVAQLLKAEAGMVLLREDGDGPTRAFVYNLPAACLREVTADAGPAGLVLRSGKPAIIDDYAATPAALRSFIAAGVESAVLVPIMAAGTPNGVLGAMSLTGSPRRFTDHDRRLLQAVALQAGIALENSFLYSTQRNIADTLQTALLTVPEKIDGLTFSHLYRSATETTKVGGDFYDLFEIKPGHAAIVIGDVSGKGLGAATLTSLIKSTIRAYTYENQEPSDALAKTNMAIRKHITDPAVFVTVFLGILEMRTGRLIYCRAGHPPPILKAGRSSVTLLEQGSPPLCVFDELSYESGRATLERNDTLVLYTDGIIEARGQTDMFGEDRLIDLIENAPRESTRSLAEEIFDEVDGHTNGHFSDDAAVLTVSLKTSE